MKKKKDFNSIVDNFEPISQLSKLEAINGGSAVVALYMISPNTDWIEKLTDKYVIKPKE